MANLDLPNPGSLEGLELETLNPDIEPGLVDIETQIKDFEDAIDTDIRRRLVSAERDVAGIRQDRQDSIDGEVGAIEDFISDIDRNVNQTFAASFAPVESDIGVLFERGFDHPTTRPTANELSEARRLREEVEGVDVGGLENLPFAPPTTIFYVPITVERTPGCITVETIAGDLDLIRELETMVGPVFPKESLSDQYILETFGPDAIFDCPEPLPPPEVEPPAEPPIPPDLPPGREGQPCDVQVVCPAPEVVVNVPKQEPPKVEVINKIECPPAKPPPPPKPPIVVVPPTPPTIPPQPPTIPPVIVRPPPPTPEQEAVCATLPNDPRYLVSECSINDIYNWMDAQGMDWDKYDTPENLGQRTDSIISLLLESSGV